MKATFFLIRRERVTVEFKHEEEIDEAEARAIELARANFIAGAAQFEVYDYEEEE